MTEVLEGSSRPMPKSDYTAAEFFTILRLLMRFFDHYMPPQGKSWEELCQTHGLPLVNPGEWRDNEATACVLLEESLRMMEAWPSSVGNFLLARMGMFDRDIRYLVWNPEARSLLAPFFALPQQIVVRSPRRGLNRSQN